MGSWEKLRILSGVLAAVVIPVVLAYVGNQFSSAIKERELQGRFVELAVQILREKPEPEATALRSWATRILDSYSGVPLAEAKQELVESRSLPRKDCSVWGLDPATGKWVCIKKGNAGPDDSLESQ